MTEATPLDAFNALLKRLGSQKAVAEKLGLSEQLIGKIVKGRRSISLDTAEKLGFELIWRKKDV